MRKDFFRPEDSSWVYFVFNWGVPTFMSYNVMGAFEFARRMVSRWGNPLPEGAVKVARYRPSAEPGVTIDEIDLTRVFLKFVSKHSYNG